MVNYNARMLKELVRGIKIPHVEYGADIKVQGGATATTKIELDLVKDDQYFLSETDDSGKVIHVTRQGKIEAETIGFLDKQEKGVTVIVGGREEAISEGYIVFLKQGDYRLTICAHNRPGITINGQPANIFANELSRKRFP